MNKKSKIPKEKLDEIVKGVILSNTYWIHSIPASDLLDLKKELELREELSNYKVIRQGNLNKYHNTLLIEKICGGQNA